MLPGEELDKHAESVPEPSAIKSLTDSRYSKATYVSLMMAIFNQVSGLNAINFYSSTIFDEVLEGENSVTVAKAMTGLAQVLGVCFAPCLSSRVSLKTTFVIGHGASAILLALVVFFDIGVSIPSI